MRPHAWSVFCKWTHQLRWRSTLWLHLPPSLCTLSLSCHPSANPADFWKCCTNWTRVHPRRSPHLPYWNEFDMHVPVHQANFVLIISWLHYGNHVSTKSQTHLSGWKLSPCLHRKTKTSSSPRWGTLWHFAHSAHAESQIFVLFIHE
jgi:hypothetical protein